VQPPPRTRDEPPSSIPPEGVTAHQANRTTDIPPPTGQTETSERALSVHEEPPLPWTAIFYVVLLGFVLVSFLVTSQRVGRLWVRSQIRQLERRQRRLDLRLQRAQLRLVFARRVEARRATQDSRANASREASGPAGVLPSAKIPPSVGRDVSLEQAMLDRLCGYVASPAPNVPPRLLRRSAAVERLLVSQKWTDQRLRRANCRLGSHQVQSQVGRLVRLVWGRKFPGPDRA